MLHILILGNLLEGNVGRLRLSFAVQRLFGFSKLQSTSFKNYNHKFKSELLSSKAFNFSLQNSPRQSSCF